MTTDDAHPCPHEREIEHLIQLSLAGQQRASTASVLASQMLVDEKMAVCKAVCGGRSPFRDIEIHPRSRKDILESLGPTGYFDILIQEWTEMAHLLRKGIRHLVRRSVAAEEQSVTPGSG